MMQQMSPKHVSKEFCSSSFFGFCWPNAFVSKISYHEEFVAPSFDPPTWMVLDRLVLSGEKSKESVASGAVQLSLDGTVEQAQFVMIFVGV